MNRLQETRLKARREDIATVVQVRDDGVRDYKFRWEWNDFCRKGSQTCVWLEIGDKGERGSEDTIRCGAWTVCGWWCHFLDRNPAEALDLKGNVWSVVERRELSETCIPLPSFGLSHQESHSLGRKIENVNAILSPLHSGLSVAFPDPILSSTFIPSPTPIILNSLLILLSLQS